MSDAARPVVVAFDGSAEAQAALRAACDLFGGRRLLVVTAWEKGLAHVATPTTPDPTGLSFPMPTAEDVATVDRAQRDHAGATAQAGVALAVSLGVTAEPLDIPETSDVGQAIGAIAAQHDAAAIVVGSRGLGAIKSTLLGSTSHRLLHEAGRPVVVVRGDH